jgi:hypothetical protein
LQVTKNSSPNSLPRLDLLPLTNAVIREIFPRLPREWQKCYSLAQL